jgi:signal transduction histidine kinase
LALDRVPVQPAPPPLQPPSHSRGGERDVLDPQDRLDFERLLQWLRLTFLIAGVLPLISFGPSAGPYLVLIEVCVLLSYAWIWLLLRYASATLLRYQLLLRLVDCGLVYLVLYNYHGFLGNAYYDSVYAFFVVAAAATHGLRGALLVSAVAGLLVLGSRLQLIAAGSLAFEMRHVTDSVFYVLFFCITGAVVTFLMRRSGEAVHRRDQAWGAELAERNSALEQTAAQLVAANRELEAFSYSVSHDLRAPLRSIHGFSQALLEDYADQLPPDGAQNLERVCAASQRMAQLIDDLLNLSQVSRSEMRPEHVDLSRLSHSVAAELQQTEPHRVAEFVIAEALSVEGDARLLRVVLQNLLGNAWKFTSKHPTARIEFGAVPREGESVYFVRDDGAGFDMAYVDKLFGAFQRLHTLSEFAGTGVGLAMVHRIVQRHGGRIWAEGAVERGATFYFTLGSGIHGA